MSASGLYSQASNIGSL